jgi:flavin reductase (DIM6/NTAB) family NADH-FMN oxidoreductase RutF
MNSSNTLRQIREAGTFGVNAMGVGGEEAVRRMATKSVDKFDGVPWFRPEGFSSPNAGVMLARGVLGYARCRVEDVVEVGDHSLVVGHIDEIFAGDVTAPLLHAERRMWFPTALPVNLAS